MPRSEPVTCTVCSRPGTVYVQDGMGAAQPYCLVHGKVVGARLRCERCGRFDERVERVLVLGHRIRPSKRTRSATSTGHLLCSRCVAAMESEQPDLFGEVRS
jgi:hypothetical protein